MERNECEVENEETMEEEMMDEEKMDEEKMDEVEHEQFTFSIHGLIFLSGEWMRKSPFSLSSMNAFILRRFLQILENLCNKCI